MHSETMTMNQFMAEMRRDLEDRLSGIYPGIRVEKQDVDKVQGESYRGLAIRRNVLTECSAKSRIEQLDASADPEDRDVSFQDQIQEQKLHGIPFRTAHHVFCLNRFPIDRRLNILTAREEKTVAYMKDLA